jgi:hypothetical protein
MNGLSLSTSEYPRTHILQFQQDAFDITNGFALSEFGFKPILTVNTLPTAKRKRWNGSQRFQIE